MKPDKIAESAYGSYTSSKTEFTLKIDNGGKSEKMKLWHVRPKFRIQSILLSVILLILLLILYNTNTFVTNSSKVICQNERNFATMNQMRTQIGKIEFQLKNDGKINKTAEAVNTTIKPVQKIKTVKPQKIEQVTPTSAKPNSTAIINKPTNIVKTTKTPGKPTTTVKPMPKTTQKATNKVPIKAQYYNVASFNSGSSVNITLSSKNVKSSEYMFDQSNFVIFEREPVPNRAWCTTEANPILTINLFKSVRPIAVSYQHLRWNGTIPDGAPMEYDVVACYERDCKVEVPLALNCKYESSGPQEQKCLVSVNRNYSSEVRKIRFYFRKTYGRSKTTCAYLIRVFAEGNDPSVPPKPSKEKCSSLIWHRKNSPWFYNNILEKNCKVWYNNKCCEDCQECCAECEIKDMNYIVILMACCLFVLFSCLFILFIGLPLFAIFDSVLKKCRKNRCLRF